MVKKKNSPASYNRGGKTRAENHPKGGGSPDGKRLRGWGRSCGSQDRPEPGQDCGVGLKSAFSDSLEVELAVGGNYAIPLSDRTPGYTEGASHLCVVPEVLSCFE
jgi:hypothetical protein